MAEAGAGAGWQGKQSGTGTGGCYFAGWRSDSQTSPQNQIVN